MQEFYAFAFVFALLAVAGGFGEITAEPASTASHSSALTVAISQ